MQVRLPFLSYKSRSYCLLLGLIVANLIYGLITFVFLASKPSLEHPVFIGYSLQRLFLLGGVLLMVVVFIGLFVLMLFRPVVHKKILEFIEANAAILSRIFLPALIVMWLLVVFGTYSVYRGAFRTLLPFFIWWGFIFFEISLGLDLLQTDEPPIVSQKHDQLRVLLGMFLLSVGVLLAFLSRYANVTVDEADHMVIGAWMTKGVRLYTDVFSHHPPLVYYWSAFIVKLFGWNIGAIRGAFAVLWFVIYGITAKVTKLYFPIGLFVLLWGGLSYFYYGNLILYQAFSGLFLVANVACLVTLADRRQIYSRFLYLWLGTVNGLILFADPRMGVVIVVSLVFLILNEVSDRQKPIKMRILNIGYSVVSLLVVVAMGALLLSLTSSLAGFYQNFIWFNERIYGKYVPVSLRELPNLMWSQITNGLFILSPQFRTKVDLFRFMWSNGVYTLFDGWIFGGFFYRLILMIVLVGFTFYKKSILGIFLYVIASFLLSRSPQGFHAGPFVMVALFLAAHFVGEPWREKVGTYRILRVLSKTALRFVRISVAFMFAVLQLNTIYYYLGDYDEMTARLYEKGYQAEAKHLQNYECKGIQAKYLIYPLDPLVYWYLNRLPASRFSFMLPWVAELGQTEVINELNSSSDVIVKISVEDPIGGMPAYAYLGDLIKFLDNQYVEVEKGIWVSPALFETCHPGAG
jgi:hypothetical protein